MRANHYEVPLPKYTFQHPDTEEYTELDCSYEELETFIASNPNLRQVFNMNIGDSVRLGVSKPDAWFQKNVIGRIKEAHPLNTIDTKFNIPREI